MKLIVACDNNGGIGYKNNLPWPKINGDLARFKKLTYGNVVIMGRKTWESLPIKPLPNRLHFIVSSTVGFYPNSCFTIPNLNYISSYKNGWIIGGAKLIDSSWDYIDEIHLTTTFESYVCDTFIDTKHIYKNYKIIHGTGHGDHNYEILVRNK